MKENERKQRRMFLRTVALGSVATAATLTSESKFIGNILPIYVVAQAFLFASIPYLNQLLLFYIAFCLHELSIRPGF